MALAEVAELAVRLRLDDKLSPGIAKINGKLNSLGSTAGKVGKGVAIGMGVVAGAGVTVLTAALKEGIEALREDKVVAAQTAAVIKSTGGAAGVTADQVAKLADKLSVLNGVSDDVVQQTENLLLTFTKIGGDILPDVTQAVIDMSAALGTDPQSAAIQLGKALQDPVKGMVALRRAGVILDDQQVKTIKSLVKQGKLHEAQAIILKEVQREFGGVAQAQADADPSRRLQVGVEKFQKALATGLLPVIEKVQTRLTEWLTKPETLATVQKIGDAIASLFTDQNLDAVASGLETAATAVSAAISAFSALPPEVKALAIGAFAINKVTGGAVGGIASTFGKILGAGLQKIFAANVTVIGTNVVTPGGGGGGLPNLIPGAGAAAAGAAGGGALAGVGIIGGALAVVIVGSKVAGLFEPNRQRNPVTGNIIRSVDDTAAKRLERINQSITALSGRTDAISQKQLAQLREARDAIIRGDSSITRGISLIDRGQERGNAAISGKLATANANLAGIRHKRTSFTVNNRFGINTYVSVRDIDRSSHYKTKVARTTQLVAQ